MSKIKTVSICDQIIWKPKLFIVEALADPTRYIEVYGMVTVTTEKDGEVGMLHDRTEPDHPELPEYYDVMVRGDSLDGECFCEVDNLTVEQSINVVHMLSEIYGCNDHYANP